MTMKKTLIALAALAAASLGLAHAAPALSGATRETVKASGSVRIQRTNAAGEVTLDQTHENLVVTTGLTHIAARMVGTPTAMGWMAIGTTNTAAALGQTTLVAEVGRVALTSATSAGAVATFVATFPAGTGTGTIVEAGVLNAVSVGTMLNRVVFGAVTKGAADTITITWTVTLS
jgi:hypothetical protein